MNNFDEEFMVKELPKIPEEYQPNEYLRRDGIISPSCRMMHWNAEFEYGVLKYLCYKRALDRSMWAFLYRAVRKRRKENEQKQNT